MSDAPRVFCYGACSTCRRALAWLTERGIVPETIDITKSPPSLELLDQALNQLGDRRRLLNTSGKSYREFGSERVKAMDDASVLAALAADGRLIKRPFLVMGDGTILTGFKDQEWERLFSV